MMSLLYFFAVVAIVCAAALGAIHFMALSEKHSDRIVYKYVFGALGFACGACVFVAVLMTFGYFLDSWKETRASQADERREYDVRGPLE